MESLGQAQWHASAVPAFRRQRQKEFKASLGYIERCLRKENRKQKVKSFIHSFIDFIF
jgi:hypothetical protein